MDAGKGPAVEMWKRPLRSPTPHSSLAPARCPARLPGVGRGSRPPVRAHVSTEVWARARRVHGARGVALRAARVQVRARPAGPHNPPFLSLQWTRVASGTGSTSARHFLLQAAKSFPRHWVPETRGRGVEGGRGEPSAYNLGHNTDGGISVTGKGLGPWAGACPPCILSLGTVLLREGSGR